MEQIGKERIENILEECERAAAPMFRKVERIALVNQKKVLDAFRAHRVALHHFSGTSGYGYDDIGRDTLCRIVAEIFDTEAAVVSPLLSGGTHSISAALFGVLRPGDTLLSITSAPYDTLMPVINGEGIGSLREFGVNYRQVDLNGQKFDFDAIGAALDDKSVRVVFVQRSRGYSSRDALSVAEIGEAAQFVKSKRSDVCFMVDNCYGAFVEETEPTQVGADVAIGSFIKNIGGGIAPTGGYIVGKQFYIDLIAGRLTAPGIGMEVGSYEAGYRPFYQGLFLAPHVVSQALKGSCLAGHLMTRIGYATLPAPDAPMYDIIRSIRFRSKEELVTFCQSIQLASPVDGYVVPEPWDMPGYEHQVIMAAGTFVGGASIELSCDSPIKEPYIAYLQGGLTYEHVKLALTECVFRMAERGYITL